MDFLDFVMRVRKTDDPIFVVSYDIATNEVIRLVNTAFVFTIQDARVSASTGTERKQKRLVGPVSAIMMLIPLEMDTYLHTMLWLIKVKMILITYQENKYLLTNIQKLIED